jgi:hypothetical protein
MGCFAVIGDPEEPTFKVTACHLNFWTLPGLFGRRVFLWDVGLTLETDSEEKGLSKIGLLLPFGTEPEAFKDLSEEILDPNTARLIFGKSVGVDGKVISYTGNPPRPPLKIVRVISASRDEEFEKDKRLRRANLSLWTIQFASKIKKGEKSYVRLRFRMRTVGRNWIWMGSNKGALIDIRVADIREIVVPAEGGAKLEAYGERFVAIENLRIFVIASAQLVFRATSPALHYMRLFEGRVWEKYLVRAVDLRRSNKLMVYQWRSDDPIDTRNNKTDPFRAFLVLSSESGLLGLIYDLLIAAGVVVGVFLVIHPEYIERTYEGIVSTLYRFIVPLSGTTIVLLLSRVLKNFGPVRKGFTKAWKIFRDAEDFMFRLRSMINL